MLNETFRDVEQNDSSDHLVDALLEILQANGVQSSSIVEYAKFWRINSPNGPLDFPINWKPFYDVKKGLATNEIVFVSSRADVQYLCKILKADVIGIYNYNNRHYFFGVQKFNLTLNQFLDDNARKIVEFNSTSTHLDSDKISTAA